MDTFTKGTISGACGAFFVYPIDVVKTRLQNQLTYSGSITCAKNIWYNEGYIRGFYRGVIPQMIGVGPEKAVKLTVNEFVGKQLKMYGMNDTTANILAGCSGGFSQVLVTNPIELFKIQYQMAGKKKNFITVLRESGFIYRGSSACFARDILFSGIYFPTYYILRDKLLEKNSLAFSSTVAGVLSGIPSAYFATPFDVIKTRIQTNRTDGITYTGFFDCATKIYKMEGFKAFWKGGIQRVIRSSPQFGVTLFVYEQLK